MRKHEQLPHIFKMCNLIHNFVFFAIIKNENHFSRIKTFLNMRRIITMYVQVTQKDLRFGSYSIDIPVYILLSYSSFCCKIDLLFRPLIFRNTSQSLQLIIESNLLNQIYQLVISKNHLQLGL